MSTLSQEGQLRIRCTECPRVGVEPTEPRERAGWPVQDLGLLATELGKEKASETGVYVCWYQDVLVRVSLFGGFKTCLQSSLQNEGLILLL